MRRELVLNVRQVLMRAGYFVSEEPELRPLAFDIIARRDRELHVIKVLTNVDSLSEAVAVEMRLLAKALRGSALVVGRRASSGDLEGGAVYMRHGVPILSIETLGEYMLEGLPPVVYAAPGGFYVNIDGARLRELREARGISLGELAAACGVSRRAVSMYEGGMSAMVEVAERLEAFLNEALVEPLDPLALAEGADADLDPTVAPAGPEGRAYAIVTSLGFRVVPFARTPMNAVSLNEDETVLTGVPRGDGKDVTRRAKAVANLAAVTETLGAFIVERQTSRITIEGLPVVGRDELRKLKDAEALLRLLQDRREA